MTDEKTMTELGYIQIRDDLRHIAQTALEALAIIALSYKYRIDKDDTPPYVYAQDVLEQLGVDLEIVKPQIEQALEHLGWPKDEESDDCERCQECGRQVKHIWHAPDDIWEKVMGIEDGSGVLCIDCFDMKAEAQHALLYWECREDEYPTLFRDSEGPTQ